MIYIVEVFSGEEFNILNRIKNELDDSIILDSYVPMKVIKKKYLGEWHNDLFIAFPGYIFIESSDGVKLYYEIKKLYTFIKLLGVSKNKKEVESLSTEEEEFIYHLLGKDSKYIINSSDALIKENKIVEVLSGPLKGFEGKISRVNLHKRTATILVNIMNREIEMELSINLIREIQLF